MDLQEYYLGKFQASKEKIQEKLSLKEKITLVKIILKQRYSKQDKIKLINVLGRLTKRDLISILGEDFRLYSRIIKILKSKDLKLSHGIIYKIINLINGKVYIGQTKKTLQERWKEHLYGYKSNKENKYLYYAMNFHGVENFIIEEIEKIPLNELDEKEKYFIERYKSYVKKFGPKYGYNLTPGGQEGAKANYKVIDRERLKSMIEGGYTSKEIGKVFKIHKTTVSEKTREFWGVNLSKMRSFLIKKNLKRLIKKCLTTQEIADEFDWSVHFVYEKVRQLWNKSLNEIRKLFLNKSEYRIFLEKDRIQRGYKIIDEDELFDLIKERYTRDELKNILDIGVNTLYNRLDEFWDFSTLNQARQAFFNKSDWKKYKKHLGETQPSYREIDEQKFIKLIKKNLSAKEIAKELSLTPWTIHKKAKELWGLTLTQARRHFIEPYLKTLILLMFTDKQIAEELNISISKLYRWLKKSWGFTLIEARRKFVQERLESLIIQHKTIEEISKYLNMSRQTVQNRIKELWGMTYSQAWKHFIKPILKGLIMKNFTARQISNILNIDDSTVFHLTQEFWGKTLKEAWRSFIKYPP